MEFGRGPGKWLHQKVSKLKDFVVNEDDEEAYAFVDKEYFRMMQISGLYVKLDKKNLGLSLFQLTLYLSILFYHDVVLIDSTILLIDINMVLFSQSVHFGLLALLTMMLIVSFQTKHRQITLYHKLLSHGFFDYQEPPAVGEDALRSSMVRELRQLSTIPIAVAVAFGVVIVVTPIVDNHAGLFDFETVSNVFSTHLPYPYARYPFQTRVGFNYYFALGGQLTFSILLTIIYGSLGILYLNVSLNVSLQLQLLQNSVDLIESRAEAMYFRLFGKTKREDARLYDDHHFIYCYSKCLRKNFKHHQVILRSYHYLEEMFSMPVFLGYMIGTIVIALSLISAGSASQLPGTKVASMLLCGVEIGYMYIFSLFGQRLGDLHMELRFKIYNIKWYLCNRRVRNNLMIFQERTLKPLTMMAGGIVPANMETFATVMNSAYSYYNLANAFEK